MFLTLSEGIFFSTIGVIFFLVVSMFYHFKRKMETLEKNNENLGTICKTIVKELEHTKQMHYEQQQQQQQQQMPKYSPPELTKEVLMNNASYEIKEKEEDTESEYSTDEESEAESDEEPEIIYEGGNTIEEVHHSESSDLIDKSETLEKDIIVEKLDIEEVMSDSTHPLSNHSEVEIVIEDSIVEIEADIDVDDLENKSISDPYTRNQLKKMTIQMLKTIMVQNQWEYDDSMKKNDLIEAIIGYSETA